MTCQTAAALHQRGLAVRRTFIDGPAEWFYLAGAGRRAHSTPPAGCLDDEERSLSAPSRAGRWREVLLPPLKHAADGGAQKRDSSPSTRSDASTGYVCPSQLSEAEESPQSEGRRSPFGDAEVAADMWQQCESGLSWLDAESAKACSDKGRELATLVEQECAFLRLNGYSACAKNNARARRQGLALNVRFFVRGLPAAKRAKWQHPLCWAAAGVLQRAGVQATVQTGELHVLVRKDLFIRLEFVSGRL